jgi:hypothetical protein
MHSRLATAATTAAATETAAKELDNSSVRAQETIAVAAAAASSTTTAAAARAAAAVPSHDAWNGYEEYMLNAPGADNTVGCVWNITLEAKPAESSFFAQRVAKATGVW